MKFIVGVSIRPRRQNVAKMVLNTRSRFAGALVDKSARYPGLVLRCLVGMNLLDGTWLLWLLPVAARARPRKGSGGDIWKLSG